MRCSCCNKLLTDFESVLRHPDTNEFLDTCLQCLSFIPIKPVEPAGEISDQDFDEDLMEFYHDDDESTSG